MGLTVRSVGRSALGREKEGEQWGRVIALAGNPNVGKSTVFNALTGLNQHTGNWPGKTVTNARGVCVHKGQKYTLVDLPGTYSLMAHSAEEEVARDFICFGGADAVVVVADATCLERNLNLVLQVIEITKRVVVCVNLMDEAKKKGISVDLKALSRRLGVPAVGTSARSGKGLRELMDKVEELTATEEPEGLDIAYTRPIEEAIALVGGRLKDIVGDRLNLRWAALKLIGGDEVLAGAIGSYLGADLRENAALCAAVEEARGHLAGSGIDLAKLDDLIVSCIVLAAEDIAGEAVKEDGRYGGKDGRLDRILTGRRFGIPIMIAMLAGVLWLTITGANMPSQLLSGALFWVEDRLTELFTYLNAPVWLTGALVQGVYRTLAWVVSVMLPPMAIFFPLFTLLEDFGYLPRVAFNLDKYFHRVSACGKQALTMCMGLGCNAAGVVGCRIIDSPRERLIAIITNNFVPCNGRFPTLIAIISMFFVSALPFGSAVSALGLTAVIVLGVVMTFWASKFLSATLLKGVPSSFTLELPPYRKPQIGKVIVRSILDRTLFVLGRAAAVAAPAGLIIWVMSNIQVGDVSLLAHCAGFLDPFARLLGLDGYILMAFILGFPANEIVVPIIIMSYMAGGSLMELGSLAQLKDLLVSHGWTWVTAVCTMLFSLMHYPCSTTMLTIHKETGSAKWTVVSFLVPTLTGMAVCFAVAGAARILGLG